MNIGIVCTPARQGEAALFRELLSAEGIEADICRVTPDWERHISRWIESDTHFMVIAEPAGLSAPWFQFLAGYCAGSGRVMLISGLPDSSALPSHLADVERLEGDRELLEYWLQAAEKWRRSEKIRRAKSALEQSGIAFTEEDFCSCVAEGQTRAVELFFNAGMTGDVRNKQGVPALCLAVRGLHRSLVAPLLAAGGEIDAVSGDRGNTALMDAAAAGSVEITGDLIQAGAELDIRSKNGQTALILAVGQGNVDLAVMLIEAGADPLAADSLGMSAYAYARLFKQQRILDLIEKRGEKEEGV
jgi:uncharacterized protein